MSIRADVDIESNGKPEDPQHGTIERPKVQINEGANTEFSQPVRSAVSTASIPGDLALFEDDTSTMPSLSAYLKSLTVGASEDESKETNTGHGKRKSKLGTLFGVYLPSIQHILGVQMFLRLMWIVGIAGFAQSFTMVFVCCLCTFLTTISISAIATNGVIDSGGAYFMISRNLGPEFGGAIGILYYLANTVATAMYLVGGVEILLKYMAPGLPQFGDPNNHHEDDEFNNFRVYATGFLLILFFVCALGVRFVQFFAPISLACVILSIVAVFIGGLTANTTNGPNVCLLGDILLHPNMIHGLNETINCNKSIHSPIWDHYCKPINNSHKIVCDPYFETNDVKLEPAIPGFGSGIISRNIWPNYMENGQSIPGHAGIDEIEITQDLSTTFFILLAIFFPSVTGIMTGCNMSGDLADPQKSIPIGTIAAQLTTSVIYLGLVIIYAGTVNGALLRDKYGESLGGVMVVAKLSWPSAWVLLVGSFTSCIGAGLQCLCSAPRLLQSIAKDDLLPFLSVFTPLTKRNEPFRALIMTTLIAECAVLIGGIDYVAPVVDFFFLMSYCFVNVACALQTLLKAPNWRPRFRFYHWSLAVLGALLNLFIMFSTFWYYAIVVLVLCAALYKYIEFKGAKKEWGDGMRGLALSTAQYSLLRFEEEDIHVKNWRPQLLVLLKLKETEELQNRKMLHVANQLKAGRGLTMVATLLVGDLSNPEDVETARIAKEKLKQDMLEAKVKGFTEVALCSNVSDNVGTFIQCVGMGSLRPNTVMLSWPYKWREAMSEGKSNSSILDAVHRATAANMCLLVAKGLHMFPDAGDQLAGAIDVWWIIHDGGLLILLPFLLRQHRVWRQCHLRIFAVAQFDDNTVKMKEDLEKWVYQLRINAEVHVVELDVNTIAPYTYERTMVMEDRAKLALNLHLSDQELLHEPQLLADRNRNESTADLFRRSSLNKSQKQLKRDLSAKAQQIHKKDDNVIHKMTEVGHLPFSLSNVNGSQNPAFSVESDDELVLLDEEEEISPNASITSGDEKKKTSVSLKKENQFALHRRKLKNLNLNNQGAEIDRFAMLDKKKLRKMHMAINLNKSIRDKSSTSRLVILNLPKPPRAKEALNQYMEYLEVLTENLERVLLVRGCGKEVITIYS